MNAHASMKGRTVRRTDIDSARDCRLTPANSWTSGGLSGDGIAAVFGTAVFGTAVFGTAVFGTAVRMVAGTSLYRCTRAAIPVARRPAMRVRFGNVRTPDFPEYARRTMPCDVSYMWDWRRGQSPWGSCR
mgnify:CR=1 FL=1